jgi:tetratricopeptide (TPR) repeat protein
MTRFLIAAVLTLTPMVAAAKHPTGLLAKLDDPDTEAARRHFQAGAEAYEAGDYQRALREFQTGKLIKATPGFDFNIARCYERLEQYPEALTAYEAYLRANPDEDDKGTVALSRERVAVLKVRIEALKVPPPAAVAPAPIPHASMVATTAAVVPPQPRVTVAVSPDIDVT